MAKKLSRIRRTFTPQFKKDAVALAIGSPDLPFRFQAGKSSLYDISASSP